jgi:hypothetical protein
MLPLAGDGIRGDAIIGASVYRVGFRPATSDRLSIDQLNETIDFFPLR